MALSAHAIAAELRRRMPGLGMEEQRKLLSYCQEHHLATFGERLFHESTSAGDSQEPTALEQLDEAQLNTIGYVVSQYGSPSGTDPERVTQSDAPWREVREWLENVDPAHATTEGQRDSVERLRRFTARGA